MEAVTCTWQPIETAPKDRWVLLAYKGHTTLGCWATDVEHGADWEGQLGMAGWCAIEWPNGEAPEPTHWMDLPEAPK